MSILDKVKNMLGGGAKTEELAKQGIDKAEEIARRKLGGKHARHIDTAARKAREMADKIDEPDTARPGTTPDPVRPSPDTTSGTDRPGTTPAPGRSTPPGRGDGASGPGQPGTTPPPYGP
ncbi:antitoxin [Streptosporangium sp. NPDC048865]|uniref:antitoxin n=1 Tax=Streptosporangium sp. NPDC048865 TaxID=3155766 RepID=UPI003437C164